MEALRAGAPVNAGDGTPMAKKGRKRKGGEEEGTPSKRGRGKKVDEVEDDGEEMVKVKDEVKDEDGVFEEDE